MFTPDEEVKRVAEAVRAACLAAAREAFEQASVSGLCCDGAWECAVGAMQTLDLSPHVSSPVSPRSGETMEDEERRART